MRRGHRLAGSLLFAALSGLGVIPWMMAARPFAGSSWALGLYSLGCGVVYVAWVAPSWPRGLAAFALAGLGALGVAVLAPMPTGGVMGAAVILAVVRSGFLYGGRPVRAFAVEGFLVGGGLVVARALAASSLLSLGFAFWGFFLFQSVYFLVGGLDERRAQEPGLDPFDAARRRAVVLMEEVP